MNSVVVAKFGGSVIGVDGISIPIIIQRINSLSKDAKVVAVFSAPLTVVEGKRRSLTDVALELGKRAEGGKAFDLIILRKTYEKILELVSSEFQEKCRTVIDGGSGPSFNYAEIVSPLIAGGIVVSSLFFVKSVNDKRRIDKMLSK